jgi:hypothetical protein
MKKKKTLRIIDSMKIGSPCTESWEAMTGDNKKRHCETCNHSVEFISELTKSEADRLIGLKDGKRLCVRYQVNSFGEIIFKAESSLVSSIWQRASLIVATLMTLLGLTSPLSAECNDNSKAESSSQSERVVMGKIKAPTDTATPKSDNEPHVLMGGVTSAYQQETPIPENKAKEK